MSYSTSKSNLDTQDLTPPRTGSFTAAAHLQPGVEVEQLKALFYQIATHLQKATDDGRTYTFEVKIVTYLTVDPMQAEIGEHVHRDRFHADPQNENMVLEDPNAHMKKRVFEPTRLGYQRIE